MRSWPVSQQDAARAISDAAYVAWMDAAEGELGAVSGTGPAGADDAPRRSEGHNGNRGQGNGPRNQNHEQANA